MSVCGVDSCEVEDESVLEEKLTIEEEQSIAAVQDAHSPYTSFTFFAYLSRCILTCYLIEIGNESVPKIIINDTIKLFFKQQSAIC